MSKICDAITPADHLIVEYDAGYISIIAVEGGGTDGLPFTAQVDLDVDGAVELRQLLSNFIDGVEYDASSPHRKGE